MMFIINIPTVPNDWEKKIQDRLKGLNLTFLVFYDMNLPLSVTAIHDGKITKII